MEEIINIEDLVQDDKNFNRGTAKGKKLMKKSLRQFGGGRSILVDKDLRIIAGNKTQQAAIDAGIKKVRVVHASKDELVAVQRDDLALDSREAREMALADNATASANLAWDVDALSRAAKTLRLSVDSWGVTFGDSKDKKDEEPDEEDAEYDEFLDKFKPKLTTDDCYTPIAVYEAVLAWCKKRYHISDSTRIMRPFKPGGDYQAEDYSGDCVVIDNPPFSIQAEICRFYDAKGVRFFLWCPYLTSLKRALELSRGTFICTPCNCLYENGAEVPTSFVTNMEPGDVVAMASPELYALLDEADQKEREKKKHSIPKYSYPANILTAAMLGYMASHQTDFVVKRSDCHTEIITELDAQKEKGKGIFGGGILLSDSAAAEKAAAEKAAAEKAAATRWPLSEREKALIASIGKEV